MLLAIDTSTRQVGVAVYSGSTVLAESTWISQDYHTAELAPAIQHILQRANLQAGSLKVLAVATGPGSFTGLRIGMALAKGIALANHLPLIGVPSLDIVAYGQPLLDIPMAAVLSAGRQRLAVGWYAVQNHAWQAYGEIEVMDAAALAERLQAPTLVCGELSEEDRRTLGRRYRNARMVSPSRGLRRPSYLAEIGYKRWLAEKVDNPATLAPIYVHVGQPIPG
jgi:tRNA threonylcarbamoyladenosine biosynthesis protein TsaB